MNDEKTRERTRELPVVEMQQEEYKAMQNQMAAVSQQLSVAQAVALKEKSRSEELSNLVNRMQADFDNYRKRMNENNKKLKEDGIDLVISTVPLDIAFPSVCVSPIPQTQDLMIISQALDAISTSRKQDSLKISKAPAQKLCLTLSDMESLTRTGQEISQLLHTFQIKELSGIRQTEALLGQAAGIFADSILSRQIISQDLARRESIRNTFISELNIHLLHCRTTAVPHCRCAYLKLENPLTLSEGVLKGALLLLAPQSDQNECVEVISRISMLLVEDKRFLQALQSGDVHEGRVLAEQTLLKYYQNLIKKRKGDGTL